ncbi:MAG: hypothetical protein WAX77_06190 [Methylococcaceae bacterium]
MKLLLRPFLWLLYATIISLLLIMYFGVSDEPDLAVAWTLTSNDIARAKKILNEGSKMTIDEIGTLELSQADVNLAANYLANRYSKSAVQVVLQDDKLKVMLTSILPRNSLGKYLNISFRIASVNHQVLPQLVGCKVGKLLLPTPIATWLMNILIEHSSLKQYVLLATRHIRAVSIKSEKITLHYYASLGSLLPSKTNNTKANEASLALYKQTINDIIVHHDNKWLLSLADLLRPLFALAYQRSTLDTAIEENRAVIIAVNDYVNKKETEPFLTDGTKVSNDLYYYAYLYKRADLAQHFIASAALTVSVNQHIAKVVGEEKELSDAVEGGTGFSFIDLAADKAGTRFGQLAIASSQSALQLQKTMSTISNYTAFMPDPTDLPEKMNTEQFKQHYESINSATYLELSKKIDERINKMVIYSNMSD